MMGHNFVRCFRITALAGFALLAGAPAASAHPPQWHYYVTKIDGIRHAFVEQKATGLGEHCSARLKFWAAPGLGMEALGSIALDLTVSPTHQCSFKGFDFDHLNAENGAYVDSRASNQPFIRVTVFRGGKRFVHSYGVYGFYEPSPDPYAGLKNSGMTFETGNSTDDKQNPIRKLVD